MAGNSADMREQADVLEQIRSFCRNGAGMTFTSDGANSLQGGAANGLDTPADTVTDPAK